MPPIPPHRPSPPREEPPSEERRRPETLQIWQERERQQQALRSQALEKRDSGLSESSSVPRRKPRTQVTEQPPGIPSPASPGQMSRQQESLPPPVSSPPAREPGSAQKPSSFLFRSTSRTAIKPGSACAPHDCTADPQHPLRLRAGSHDLDEKELTAQLRKVQPCPPSAPGSPRELPAPSPLGGAPEDPPTSPRASSLSPANRSTGRFVPSPSGRLLAGDGPGHGVPGYRAWPGLCAPLARCRHTCL
nr:leucine-rich repeat and calponin homology domain-containing protein 4-like isoform X2 [Chrysemys picta bellii]